MKVTCVLDNQVLEGSALHHEHGLSFWIETENGSVLFDTGQTAEVLSHNLKALGISTEKVKLLALSHAHYDHTGGINAVLDKGNRPAIYATSPFFMPRYALRGDDYQFIGMNLSQEKVYSLAQVYLSDEPVEILPGLWTTGAITKRDEPQGRNQNHFIRSAGGWIADPYLDDMALVMETVTGLVLICGCCHAGLLNTIFHIRQFFTAPIKAIIGGIHLKPADDSTIEYVINSLKSCDSGITYFLNHCTGENAFLRFSQAFKGQVFRCPAGTRLDFTAAGLVS